VCDLVAEQLDRSAQAQVRAVSLAARGETPVRTASSRGDARRRRRVEWG
jgi:hypothetical protein